MSGSAWAAAAYREMAFVLFNVSSSGTYGDMSGMTPIREVALHFSDGLEGLGGYVCVDRSPQHHHRPHRRLDRFADVVSSQFAVERKVHRSGLR